MESLPYQNRSVVASHQSETTLSPPWATSDRLTYMNRPTSLYHATIEGTNARQRPETEEKADEQLSRKIQERIIWHMAYKEGF